MAQEPPWGPDDTGAVPVGPEPEPTGSRGSGGGPGGWGEEARTEPFAIAALVWAVVSIVIPLVGTIIAIVLAGRAADSIRSSQGTRKGQELVTAARVVAGLVIALWAVGLVLFVALRDDTDKDNVAIPTQPTVTSTVPQPSTTTRPPITTAPAVVTTAAPVTTALPATTSVIPPIVPPTTPPTTPPTAPPTTAPPVTTSPDQRQAAILQERMLSSPLLGSSNRGIPDAQQYVVQYTSGQPIVVRWQINNGALPATKRARHVRSTDHDNHDDHDAASEHDHFCEHNHCCDHFDDEYNHHYCAGLHHHHRGGGDQHEDLARSEARQILRILRQRRSDINITDIQLVGIYPMTGNANAEVVKVRYSKNILNAPVSFPTAQAFQVPPAEQLECINAAFL